MKKTYNGKQYTALPYNGRPADFMPDEDEDPQCKLCALMPSYCKMHEECHGSEPYIFVNSIFIEAMEVMKQKTTQP